MEATMFQSSKTLRALVATLALSTTVGCADLSSPPPQAATENGPELAGAWYQVYFDTNSAELSTRGQKIIKSVAYVVANNDTTRVTVIGKTDRVGAPPANMNLSQRRAHAVRDALLAAGVRPDRIDTSWTGEGHQDVATANSTAEIRDRVVDITVVKLPG
jgi:peptidoglycan-associated lipoprotein